MMMDGMRRCAGTCKAALEWRIECVLSATHHKIREAMELFKNVSKQQACVHVDLLSCPIKSSPITGRPRSKRTESGAARPKETCGQSTRWRRRRAPVSWSSFRRSRATGKPPEVFVSLFLSLGTSSNQHDRPDHLPPHMPVQHMPVAIMPCHMWL